MIRRLAPWLALGALVAATLLVWQGRFAAISGHPVNGDAGFGNRLAGWQLSGAPDGVRVEHGCTVASFASPVTAGGLHSATGWFGRTDGLRLVHVRTEVRWEVGAGRPGLTGRANPHLLVLHKTANGRVDWQRTVTCFIGSGRRGWHREEAVVELPPAARELGLTFQASGRPATMEARRLRVTAVRPRAWLPAAAGALVLTWTAWAAWWLRRGAVPLPWWRAVAGAAILVAAAWLLVLPGPESRARPFIGGFMVAAAPGSTPAPAPTAPTAPAAPAAQPAQPAPRPAPAPPAAPGRSFRERVRELDIKLDLVHLAAFFVVALAVFGVAGGASRWRLPVVLAILSEAVPAWHEGWHDTGDILDLASDLCGVALAAGAIHLLVRRVRRDGPAQPAAS